ncbi:MAG: hypothetical protein PHU85_10025 [Phycisphaerae bacterium]|nr:hypothetical protein [Phycisphaerae bacterium]
MTAELDELIATIAAMSRDEISTRLLNFKSDFPLDFTRDYLDRLPLDRLGHILLAAHLYQSRKQRKASA